MLVNTYLCHNIGMGMEILHESFNRIITCTLKIIDKFQSACKLNANLIIINCGVLFICTYAVLK